jgi:hypothetical protein
MSASRPCPRRSKSRGRFSTTMGRWWRASRTPSLLRLNLPRWMGMWILRLRNRSRTTGNRAASAVSLANGGSAISAVVAAVGVYVYRTELFPQQPREAPHATRAPAAPTAPIPAGIDDPVAVATTAEPRCRCADCANWAADRDGGIWR